MVTEKPVGNMSDNVTGTMSAVDVSRPKGDDDETTSGFFSTTSPPGAADVVVIDSNAKNSRREAPLGPVPAAHPNGKSSETPERDDGTTSKQTDSGECAVPQITGLKDEPGTPFVASPEIVCPAVEASVSTLKTIQEGTNREVKIPPTRLARNKPMQDQGKRPGTKYIKTENIMKSERVRSFQNVENLKFEFNDRDPMRINGDLKFTFSEVFAEPDDSIHSLDGAWRASGKTYTHVKLWWYRVLTVFCAIPCACVWGLLFACMSFIWIWMWSPWIRAFRIGMLCSKSVLDNLLNGLVTPLFEAVGKVFSFIHITLNRRNESLLL